MAIEMFCDHCDELVAEDVNGGCRLKLGKKEYIFHLCAKCQELLRKEVKSVFLDDAPWREI